MFIAMVDLDGYGADEFKRVLINQHPNFLAFVDDNNTSLLAKVIEMHKIYCPDDSVSQTVSSSNPSPTIETALN
jgi:hypothetical protein